MFPVPEMQPTTTGIQPVHARRQMEAREHEWLMTLDCPYVIPRERLLTQAQRRAFLDGQPSNGPELMVDELIDIVSGDTKVLSQFAGYLFYNFGGRVTTLEEIINHYPGERGASMRQIRFFMEGLWVKKRGPYVPTLYTELMGKVLRGLMYKTMILPPPVQFQRKRGKKLCGWTFTDATLTVVSFGPSTVEGDIVIAGENDDYYFSEDPTAQGLQVPPQVGEALTVRVRQLPWIGMKLQEEETYRHHADSYASVIGTRHQAMMFDMLYGVDTSKYHLIVPGDGYGLAASIYKGTGTYGDKYPPARHHPDVRTESFEETLQRGREECPPEKLPLVLMSYVASLFDRHALEMATIWFDVPYQLIETPTLRRINDVTYSEGYDGYIPNVTHRETVHATHQKYSENLLRLIGPMTYVRFSHDLDFLIRLNPEMPIVPAVPGDAYALQLRGATVVTTEKPIVQMVTTLKEYSESEFTGRLYATFMGRHIQPSSHKKATSPLGTFRCRAIYEIDSSWAFLLPSKLLTYDRGRTVLFCYPEDKPAVLPVRGVTLTGRFNGKMQFRTDDVVAGKDRQ